MADVAGNDWRALRPDTPSAADLFDSAHFEARLVEARARRGKALAARSQGATPAKDRPSSLSLERDPWDRLVRGLHFLGGIAVGAIAAVAATQVIFGASAPAPHVAVIAAVPSRPMPPTMQLTVASVHSLDFDAGNAGPPALTAAAAETDPGWPKSAVTGIGAAPSKARLAGAVPSTPAALRLAAALPKLSIMRASFGAAAPEGGGSAAGAFDLTRTSGRYPGARPAEAANDRAGKPVRTREPSRSGALPQPSEPPTAKPPATIPKPPPVATPKPPSSTPKPINSAQGGPKHNNPGRSVRDPASSGPPGQRGGVGNGPPDHAHAGGRSAGHGSSGKGNGANGSRGNSGKDSKGSGNGNGRNK